MKEQAYNKDNDQNQDRVYKSLTTMQSQGAHRQGVNDLTSGEMFSSQSPLFDFNNDYTLCYDNPLFDEEFEDISSLDPPESTPVIDESSLLVTPLTDPKQICLREVDRFDPFFSLTQSGDMSWVMERPSYRFPHMPSPRPSAYSPKVVIDRYFHPHLTSGDGLDHGTKMK
ncbi:hypothetical protein Tco_0280738 [Tanacetum coccineum]